MSSVENKSRVTYLDLAKGVGIILVVLGHMENIPGELRIWISSFHMPLFFVISGMLIAMKKEENRTLSDNLVKKAKGILIPYMWFSFIYIPIDIMNLYIQNVDKHTFVQNILDSVTMAGVSVMWFLPALFIAETLALFIIKKAFQYFDSRSKKSEPPYIVYIVIIVISLIISVLTFGIWDKVRIIYENVSAQYAYGTLLGIIRTILRGMCMSFHVVTGYLFFNAVQYAEEVYIAKQIKKNSSEITELIKTRCKNIIKGILLALGVILAVINAGLCMKNEAVDNHFLTLNNLPLYYLCAFLGSVSIILICMGFDTIKPIDFLGKNSLIIMATHLQCYLLYAGILVAIAIDAYVTRAKSYVYMFNSVLFTMLFETIVIFVINKFFPFVIGKGSIKDIIAKRNN